MNPKVSIVIPARNEEKFIAECLKTLKAQTYKGPIEIIVVDNNSSDATQHLAKEAGVIVAFEPRPGVVFARETGTRLAKGEYIIQTDADSTFPANWLEQIMNEFEKNPKAVAVAGSFVFDDGPWWGSGITFVIFGIIDTMYRTTGRVVYLPGSNAAFRKDAWHGYNMKYDQGGDESALLKQLRSEGDIIFLRHNTISTSARRLEKGFFYNIVVTFLFYRVFDYSRRRISGKPSAAAEKEMEERKIADSAI